MGNNITQIVAAALEGASEQYMIEIIDHGIHNLTNDYQGETDDEYAEFADEFKTQAEAALASIEKARMTKYGE